VKPETRQTVIGVLGLTIVEVVALREGFNGAVTVSYFVAVIALAAPETLDRLPISISGGG